MGPLESTMRITDQTVGFMLAVVAMLVAFLGARWAFRRRFPHVVTWVTFVGWSVLVAAIPALAALDDSAPWFYSVRGATWGLLAASMLSLKPRQTPLEEPAPAAER